MTDQDSLRITPPRTGSRRDRPPGPRASHPPLRAPRRRPHLGRSGLPPILRVAFALVVAVLATAGCADSSEPGADSVVQDSAGVLIHEFPETVLEQPAPIRLADSPELRIGVVEGEAAYQWTRPVAGARLADGSVVIAERVPAELRVFDPDGTFLHRIGTEGEGPGEFRTLAGVAALPGDTVVVWDQGAQRLSWFAPDGTLVRELTPREPGGIRNLRRVTLAPAGPVIVLGPTTTVEDIENQGRVRESWNVVPLGSDEAGEAAPGLERSLGQIPGTEQSLQVQRNNAGQIVSVAVQGRWWWGEGYAAPSERGVWTADKLAFEARHFDPDSGLDRIVRIAGEPRAFTPSLIDSLHQIELDRVDDPDIRALWEADFEGREYPEVVPPVASIFADRAGRVWIGRLDPPPGTLSSGTLPSVRRWVLFEEDDAGDSSEPRPLRALGTLGLPPQSHPLWADDEGVLLLRIDPDFDVPYVEWYEWVAG